MKETDLYPPLKTYLENQGYAVSGEVKNCDIVARKGEDIVIVELKTRLSVTLLEQAVKRKEITESVYIAVPMPAGRRRYPGLGDLVPLLRRLEVGFITVSFLKNKSRVEVVLHPEPAAFRNAVRKRAAIIREIDSRYAEIDQGGRPAAKGLFTAYRQEAVRLAYLVRRGERLSPKQLRELGGGPKTQSILSRNVYGWFIRVDKGVYAISPEGRESLEVYRDIIPSLFPAGRGQNPAGGTAADSLRPGNRRTEAKAGRRGKRRRV